MARGDKDYFRHSFRSRNDDFIVFLMQKMKEKGYFMWFALVELCSERMADGEDPPFTFNQSTLYKELRCTHSKLNLFLTYCESMLKVESTYVEPMFNIDIKNLNKFNGHYSKKRPNKRKEKEIKEKKRKGKENKENTEQNPNVILFTLSNNPQAISFISKVTVKTQQVWIDTYQEKEWIERELLKATAWLLNNPQKNPKSNWGRFFSNWLSRGFEAYRKTIPSRKKSTFDHAMGNINNNPYREH